ncbi:hypothetical protein ACFV0R_25700 [Streptomyces sp. NPDC059578]|uniref:hypothetical protein n=1 Tax=Streptomyces sp. NPDC059578 TaxID=3346874 RepID=UPI00368AFE54
MTFQITPDELTEITVRLRRHLPKNLTTIHTNGRAAYVAALRTVIGTDMPALWATYQTEAEALTTAYAYLRSPEATTEWLPAIARLVDAQDSTVRAAVAFDARAHDLALVHDRHKYADMSPRDALTAAGHPDAAGWHIAPSWTYGCRGHGETLAEQTSRLTQEQNDIIATVSRLAAGAPAGH